LSKTDSHFRLSGAFSVQAIRRSEPTVLETCLKYRSAAALSIDPTHRISTNQPSALSCQPSGKSSAPAFDRLMAES